MGNFGSVEGSRVRTVLHESMHWVTGTTHVFVNNLNEDGSARVLIANNDWRTFINTTNYETFYMRPW